MIKQEYVYSDNLDLLEETREFRTKIKSTIERQQYDAGGFSRKIGGIPTGSRKMGK